MTSELYCDLHHAHHPFSLKNREEPPHVQSYSFAPLAMYQEMPDDSHAQQWGELQGLLHEARNFHSRTKLLGVSRKGQEVQIFSL
jgi:hypothetical protein